MAYYKSITAENGREGRDLRINALELEISRYELPASKYSGGTANQYPIGDYKKDSKVYQEVERFFGEEIAIEVLKYIQNIENDPEYHKTKNSINKINNFFHKLPIQSMSVSILIAWK